MYIVYLRTASQLNFAARGTNWHCRPSELRALQGLPLELQEATRRLGAAQPLCCVPWAKWRRSPGCPGDFMVFLGKIWGKYRNIWEKMGYFYRGFRGIGDLLMIHDL